jgi:exodeoxyribonuclease VII large subunit
LNYPEAIEQLQKKGLWPKRPKHPLPEVIQKIGLITSQGSLALADFRTAYQREGGEAVIEEAFAPVQGQDAPGKIAANINRFSQSRSVDMIVITRGGGSANDLSKVFDSYLIAEAICQSTIPVLTAIGHTEDQTLADFVADTCEITPTAAAVCLAKIPAWRNRSGGILDTLGQLLR